MSKKHRQQKRIDNVIPINSGSNSIKNDFNGAGIQSWGMNQNTFGTQLSQVNELFNNNRWYLISNMRQLLSELYVEHGLIRTIVDLPVDDAFRGGIEISSKQLDEEELQKLQISIKRNNDLNIVAQAIKWNRLFGGSGVLIMTDQDPIEPLDVEEITEDSNLEFRAVDMWELFYDKQNAEGYNPAIQSEKFTSYDYYGTLVDKSRVMRMKGLTAPSFIRPRLRGWGFSVVEHLVRSINQYLKSNNLTYEVLDEFKIDMYKLEGLSSTLLSADGQAAVKRRVQDMNWQKSYQNAVTMDSKDDFVQKQLSFAGLADTMKEIRMQIASDMRIPLTKLFGISAAGFNSGEDDIENYNAMVEGDVRGKAEFDVLRVVEIRCQKLFGFIPTDLSIAFKSLRMLSSVDEETVKTQKFGRIMQATQAGLMSTSEFRDACNRAKLVEIQLDNTKDKLNPDDSEVEEIMKRKMAESKPDEASEDGESKPSTQDSGSNKEDTMKIKASDSKSTSVNIKIKGKS